MNEARALTTLSLFAIGIVAGVVAHALVVGDALREEGRAAEVAADPAPEQKKDLYASDSPLQLDGNERQQIISYVLLRLDSELSKGQASYNYPIITVEQVHS